MDYASVDCLKRDGKRHMLIASKVLTKPFEAFI